MRFSKLFASAALAVATLTGSSAFAAIYTGNNANFTFSANDVNDLYGSPIVDDTGLSFLPTGFRAISTNGVGALTSGTVQIRFDAVAGAPGFQGVSLSELGDYLINAGGSVREYAFFTVRVLDQNYTGTRSYSVGSNPGFNTATATGASGSWTDDLAVVFTAPARSIILNLNNNLAASSLVGGSSIIQKKAIDGGESPGINLIVPEPTSLAAVLGGLTLVGFRRRMA